MAKNNENTSKLKLIHLLWMILIVAVGAGIAWGIAVNQQSVNTKEIERKVDTDLFNMYMTQQREQFEVLDRGIIDGFNKIDKRLERIEAK